MNKNTNIRNIIQFAESEDLTGSHLVPLKRSGNGSGKETSLTLLLFFRCFLFSPVFMEKSKLNGRKSIELKTAS